ncbi:hypothetical protein ASZ90_009201 [hydrocarbon metagenome]|uniref:Uncharacterized protein n=1 Tax=hydrocarbon metagenome TaxID=938273 RepID=A0A0W8FJH0_9ZZZZ
MNIIQIEFIHPVAHPSGGEGEPIRFCRLHMRQVCRDRLYLPGKRQYDKPHSRFGRQNQEPARRAHIGSGGLHDRRINGK